MEMMLTQRQTQSLAMTARMQASLKILQMGNMDLAAHLAEEALENPCLEIALPQLPSSAGARQASDWDPVAALESGKPSLYEHVSRQIALAFSNPAATRVAFAFTEALDPTGWLGQPVEAVAATARVPLSVAEAVLARLQQFEPAGLFARGLGDCLRLQAEDQGLLTWELSVILENLSLIAEGRIADLAEMCDGTPADVQNALRVIRGFDPKPGLAFSIDPAPIQPPDLRVTREAGAWVVEVNRSTLPAITVRDVPNAADNAQARAYAKQALSRARWLSRTVERRQTTLLRTAAVLVRRQEAFLDKGKGHLCPLTAQDLAEEISLHPSTISRAVAGCLIETPRGTLPLRSFFSRAFTPGTGDDGPSQDAVIALVSDIVGRENPARPFSDAAIVAQAKEAGVTLARRTVAKYRDMLGIPSSYNRRQRALVSG